MVVYVSVDGVSKSALLTRVTSPVAPSHDASVEVSSTSGDIRDSRLLAEGHACVHCIRRPISLNPQQPPDSDKDR